MSFASSEMNKRSAEGRGTRAPRKRNRPTLVCNVCRQRKTKCDREYPCSCCMRAGVAHLCSYGSPAVLILTAQQQQQKQLEQDQKVQIPPLGQQDLKHSTTTPPPQIPSISTILPAIADPQRQTSAFDESSVQAELESLKNKFKELEASITVASLHRTTRDTVAENEHPVGQMLPLHVNGIPVTTYSKIPMTYISRKLDPNPLNLPPPLLNEQSINFFRDVGSEANHLVHMNKTLPFLAIARKDAAIHIFLKFKQSLKKDIAMSNETTSGPRFDCGGTKLRCIMNQVGIDDHNSNKRAPAVSVGTRLEQILDEGNRMGSIPKQNPFDTNRLNNPDKNLVPPSLGERNTGDKSLEEIERTRMNEYGSLIGVVFNERPDSNSHHGSPLVEKVLNILPKERVLWRLVSRFFSVVYPFMPILDEYSFRPELKRMIGTEDYKDSHIPHLNITKKQDFVFIAITLILARLSYLSLLNNSIQLNEAAIQLKDSEESPRITPDDLELQYLLKNPIPVETIEIARLCLQEVDVMRKQNLQVFQCMLLFRAYRVISPEQGDLFVGGDMQVINGLLVSTAYSLGLNRDPDYYCELHTSDDERTKNLRRKLWHYLLSQDVLDSISSGGKFSIHDDNYDTKLPVHYLGSTENVFDINLEVSVISAFAQFDKIRKAIVEVVHPFFKLGNTPILKFLQSVRNLEDILTSELGTLEEYLNPSYNAAGFQKTLRLCQYLYGHLLLTSVYYTLFLYYEKRGDTNESILYFTKLFSHSMAKVLPYLMEILDETQNYLTKGFLLILTPIVIMVNHNSNLVWSTVCIRVFSTIRELHKSTDHSRLLSVDIKYKQYYELLEMLRAELLKIRRQNMSVTYMLSNRYYAAWKVKRIHSFAYKLLCSEDLYNVDKEVAKKVLLSIPSDILSEIVNDLRRCRDRKDNDKATSLKLDSSSASATSTPNAYLNYPNSNNGGFHTPTSMFSPTGDDDFSQIEDPRSDEFWLYVFLWRQWYQDGAYIQCNRELFKSKPENANFTEEANPENANGSTPGPSMIFQSGTPGGDFSIESMQYDFGIFDGQSYDDFLTANPWK